jgi:hypothetical protein
MNSIKDNPTKFNKILIRAALSAIRQGQSLSDFASQYPAKEGTSAATAWQQAQQVLRGRLHVKLNPSGSYRLRPIKLHELLALYKQDYIERMPGNAVNVYPAEPSHVAAYYELDDYKVSSHNGPFLCLLPTKKAVTTKRTPSVRFGVKSANPQLEAEKLFKLAKHIPGNFARISKATAFKLLRLFRKGELPLLPRPGFEVPIFDSRQIRIYLCNHAGNYEVKFFQQKGMHTYSLYDALQYAYVTR